MKAIRATRPKCCLATRISLMTTRSQSEDKLVSKTSDGSMKDQKWIKFTPTKKGTENSLKKLTIPDLDIASLILFEDNHMLVLNKPPVVLTQGDASGQSNLLDTAKEFLVSRGKKPGAAFLGLIHRIDRPCSGVVVFAKTSKAAARISESFRERKVSKDYLCVVNGYLKDSGRCDNLLLPNTSEKTFVVDHSSVSPKAKAGMVEAKLRYESVLVMERVEPGELGEADKEDEAEQEQKFDGHDDEKPVSNERVCVSKEPVPSFQTLLRVRLETGRKHQIRAQMAHIGHPIVGDIKYGAPESFKSKDIALHAYALTVPHPITAVEMRFTAPPPQSWLKRFGRPAILAAEALRDQI